MSSTVPPSSDPPNNPEGDSNEPKPSSNEPSQETAAMDTTPDQPPEETWADIPEEVMSLSTDEILTRIRLIENDIKVFIFL